VGLVWFCGEEGLEEDLEGILGHSMGCSFEVRVESSFLERVLCNNTARRIVWNCIVLV
jgi:hypothetical protein